MKLSSSVLSAKEREEEVRSSSESASNGESIKSQFSLALIDGNYIVSNHRENRIETSNSLSQ